MNINKAILGAAVLGALTIPSLAFGATATANVNVRNAPGNGAVVDVLRPGQQVEIDRCNSSGWCYVIKPGPDGWVSSSYLTNDNRPRPPVSGGRPDVDVNIGFSVPGFSFQIGSGGFDRPGRPGRPGGRDQVCFYEHDNYGGNSFCARPGETIASLGRWNDTISSIRVRGDAQAQVCEDNNFRGRCVIVSRSVSSLGGANDKISSIRVR